MRGRLSTSLHLYNSRSFSERHERPLLLLDLILDNQAILSRSPFIKWHLPESIFRCRTAGLTAARVAADTEAVEVTLMGTMTIPEAIPATTPAKTTPKTTPTGMKTLGLDFDDWTPKPLLFVELVWEISAIRFTSL